MKKFDFDLFAEEMGIRCVETIKVEDFVDFIPKVKIKDTPFMSALNRGRKESKHEWKK